MISSFNGQVFPPTAGGAGITDFDRPGYFDSPSHAATTNQRKTNKAVARTLPSGPTLPPVSHVEPEKLESKRCPGTTTPLFATP